VLDATERRDDRSRRRVGRADKDADVTRRARQDDVKILVKRARIEQVCRRIDKHEVGVMLGGEPFSSRTR
jgi:hypothetical protein